MTFGLEQHDKRRNPVRTQRHPQTDLDFGKYMGPKPNQRHYDQQKVAAIIIGCLY